MATDKISERMIVGFDNLISTCCQLYSQEFRLGGLYKNEAEQRYKPNAQSKINRTEHFSGSFPLRIYEFGLLTKTSTAKRL